jgi:hypothetical protein
LFTEPAETPAGSPAAASHEPEPAAGANPPA